MKRRDFLLTACAIAGGAGLHAANLGAAGLAANLGQRRVLAPYDLTIQNAHYRFSDHPPTSDMVSLSPQAPPPVLVGHQAKPMMLNVRNTLPDYTSMHWHGLRIANAMDGVPYLTQMPIATDETFSYAFTPPRCWHLLVSPALYDNGSDGTWVDWCSCDQRSDRSRI